MKATQLYRERFSDRRHPSNVEIRNYEFNVRQGYFDQYRKQPSREILSYKILS